MRVFLLFIGVASLFDFAGLITARNGINNLLLFYIYNAVEYTMVAYFLSLLVTSKIANKVVLISIPILILNILYYVVFINRMLVFDVSIKTAECLLVVFGVIYYFTELYLNDNPIELRYFWINLGLLFYFMVNVFAFLLLNKYSDTSSFISNRQLWTLHSFCNIIANLLYSLGFICNPRQHKLV